MGAWHVRDALPLPGFTSTPAGGCDNVIDRMRRFSFTFTAFALCLAVAGACAERAAAQAAGDPNAPTAAETTLAREQFRAGVDAARSGRWWEALEAFTRAYELAPRPITLLNLAGAQVETGHLVEGAESYRRFIREAEGRATEQVPAAEEALASVEPRIARVRLEISNLARRDLVELDDAPLSEAVLGAELPVNPGEHVVRVERADEEIGRESFRVEEGERRIPPVLLQLPLAPLEPEDEDAAVDSGGSSLFASPWFWVIVGVVVVGAAIGIGVAVASGGQDPFAGNIPPGSWSVR